MPFLEVKKKFGQAIATSILQEKKGLEANKSKSDNTVYFMQHPYAPGNEDPWIMYLSFLLDSWKVLFFKCVGLWYISQLVIHGFTTYKFGTYFFPACLIYRISVADAAAQEWSLIRVWDAMEYEEEKTDALTMAWEASGAMDRAQTKTLL